MSSSTSGRALITDFDGTLLRLAVDWAALRAALHVSGVRELWQRSDSSWMERVAELERAGVARGTDVPGALGFVRSFNRFAVLTDNSETAVRAFLDSRLDLSERCAVVAGRETLLGPKTDRETFARGIAICLRVLGAPPPARVVYLGDSERELELARELDLEVVDVATLLAG